MVVISCRIAALVVARHLAKIFARGPVLMVGSALIACCVGFAVPLRAAPLEPGAVVGQFNDSLLAAMAQGGRLGYHHRYDILARTVESTFDVALMTKIAVGPGWDALPPDQQHRITEAFKGFMTAVFAARFDDYAGEKFEIGNKRTMGTGTLVENQMVMSNGERIQINYLMHETPQGWRVVDVYLNGTISELAVHRSEFTAILKRSGPEGLITALERKTQNPPEPG
ncbi:MAG: ABC transporter substrate-binding protein [Alphaproteobacteria bacterium]|nr:ABC transporter substrate-binding protein [Alphaproteobacteria bacterium]